MTQWIGIGTISFVVGLFVGQAATGVKAQPSGVPAWVTVGSCYRSTAGIEFVYQIEGSWVRTENDNPVQEGWRNLAATPVVLRIPDRICKAGR